jgi:hypothetical protein
MQAITKLTRPCGRCRMPLSPTPVATTTDRARARLVAMRAAELRARRVRVHHKRMTTPGEGWMTNRGAAGRIWGHAAMDVAHRHSGRKRQRIRSSADLWKRRRPRACGTAIIRRRNFGRPPGAPEHDLRAGQTAKPPPMPILIQYACPPSRRTTRDDPRRGQASRRRSDHASPTRQAGQVDWRNAAIVIQEIDA